MKLLDLPPELFHKILVYTVIARGIRRALRLQLVCKAFLYATKPALFETRILDTFYATNIGEYWYIKNRHGAEELWHSYLVYRVQNETHPLVGRYIDIRRMAYDICREAEIDVSEVIHGLCWLALEKSTEFCGHTPLETCRKRVRPISLLSAAAYFDLRDLAEALLLDQHCPDDDGNGLFPPPMQVAAWRGHFEMLELFQRHMPETKVFPAFEPNPVYRDMSRWSGKIGLSPIIGAAIRGDMAMLQLAFYPPSRDDPETSNFAGQPYGTIEPSSMVGSQLHRAQGHTRSLEVFKYIEGFFTQQNYARNRMLLFHSEWGNVAMVEFFLDHGADMNCGDDMALVLATQRCQEEVIDLLLERGADPNVDRTEDGAIFHMALEAAASTGSLRIVQKLIAHGAYVHKVSESYLRSPPLYWAFATEHEAMIHFLLTNGATLQDVFGQRTLGMAICSSQDTMVKMLLEFGVPSLEDDCPEMTPDDISTWRSPPWASWRTFFRGAGCSVHTCYKSSESKIRLIF